MSEDEEREIQAVQEESRLRVLTDRRKTIRGILKAAEATKNYRINNGMVTEIEILRRANQSSWKVQVVL